MSCCEVCIGIACKKRTAEAERISESRKNRAHHAMKPLVGWTKVAVMGVLSLQVCVAAFAQEDQREQGLGASPQSSPTGQTGTGTGSTGMAAAKPGQADGKGNPRLGGERRPLYRLTRSDVVTLSFTLSPEFDQILTILRDRLRSAESANIISGRGLRRRSSGSISK